MSLAVVLTAVASLQALAQTEEFDPNTVTPGVIGFLVTFGIAVMAVLLAFDMVRRVRRTRYRAEIAEQLDAEEAESRAIARAGADDARDGAEDPDAGADDGPADDGR